MKWEKVKLGDVIDTCLGKMLDKNKNHGVYQPYLANLNVRWGSFSLDNLEMMKFEESENERYGLKYGDLVICEGGEPGRCAVWKNAVPNMKIQKALHRVRTHQCLYNFYLYYWFLLAGKTGELEQYFTGATIKHMPAQKLREVVISLPPLPIQQRIASILSAYDELIENNQKQIKLLEEAAQRLYKEWFVDLRFPGHEGVKIVDGVPEGWRSCKLRDVAEINERNIDENYPYDKINYIDIGSVRNGRILEKANYNLEEAPGRAKRIAQDGDVIWGMVRPNLKAYAMVLNPEKNDVFSTGFAVLTSKKVPFSFLYCNVTTEEFVRYLVNCTNGAAYPAVKPIHFQEYNVSIPENNLLNKFHDITETYFRKIYYLSNQISSLREARDRLLPKLMSGEIEV